MVNYEALKARLQELTEREWDLPAIEARYRKLALEGIPQKNLNRNEIIAHKQEILGRVQRRGEEYCHLSHSCSKGSALALMEEFGLGNMEIIKAMSPMPGLCMSGWTCGPIVGGLVVMGLYFGSDNMMDREANGRVMSYGRTFMDRFKTEVGTILCPEIQEKIVFGRYMDPRSSQENFEAFEKAGGHEKCPLLPGIGARIAAEVIIESMEDEG